MKKVFISSVINGFEEYRKAVKAAIELMDHRPIMSESFSARSYSSETACINEVEQSDIYLVILGEEYGFETSDGLSVTHSEFRAAKNSNRPVLVFIQDCEMEEKQISFKKELEDFQGGYFRASFSSAYGLKDEVIKALRQLEVASQAINETDFLKKVNKATEKLSNGWGDHPELILSFLPQPERSTDIVGLEEQLDNIFHSMSTAGLVELREGYEIVEDSDMTGLKSGKLKLSYFPDGLMVLYSDPVIESDNLFSNSFVPPEKIKRIASGFFDLINENSGYVYIGLRVMDGTFVAPVPTGNSMNIKMFGQEKEEFSNLFIPLTVGAYHDWIDLCIKRFSRTFKYK